MVKHLFSKFILPGLLFLSLVGENLRAGNLSPLDTVYKTAEVARVDIIINADFLSEILAPGNEESYYEYPATFIFHNSLTNDTITNIGFRLRGNTSRFSAKKSFKVSFNTFEDKKFHGLEKLNLNGEHNDPSIIRSRISWELFQKIGLPAPHSSYVELYINSEYRGLYINVEHVDDRFVKSRFGNNNGNLYKCLWPADLNYLGSDPEVYKFSQGNRRAYDLKTNTDIDDYSDLAHFIDVLNNSSNADFEKEITKVLNINGVIKYMVIEILAGHWDAYSFNKNNYYLYFNTATQKFEFIPYDLDNTFGIDWFGIDWASRDIYNWSSSESRPLYERIMQSQLFKKQFSFYMNRFLQEYFNNTYLFASIDSIKSLIDPFVEADPYAPLDYGWTFDDYETSYTEALGAHVTYGLKPFITTRNNYANNQLIINDISPIFEWHKINLDQVENELIISAKIIDEGIVSAFISFMIDNNELASLPMSDDGLGSDQIANDNIFTASLDLSDYTSSVVKYYLTATDEIEHESRFPFSGFSEFYFNTPSAKLLISEFMASNSISIVDNFGEFDDWIEIYNADTGIVFLGNKFLTDNITNPDKWQLPGIYLQPLDYYLVWADSDPEQGANHASFKLSRSGEDIAIFEQDAGYFNEITSLTFGEQIQDVSSGIEAEDEQIFAFMETITPNYGNYDNSQGTVTVNVNMSYQQKLGNFDTVNDFVDVAGTFNNWDGSGKLFDKNEDLTYPYTLFNLPVNETIEYKFRINADWATSEFPNHGPNREFTVVSGLSTLNHWYNDEVDPNTISITDTKNSNVSIYPNPFQGEIHISGIEKLKCLKVYEINGSLIQVISQTDLDLTLKNLNQGIYIAEIRTVDGGIYYQKIIKRIN